jgi:hypothetical protein
MIFLSRKNIFTQKTHLQAKKYHLQAFGPILSFDDLVFVSKNFFELLLYGCKRSKMAWATMRNITSNFNGAKTTE